jgi:geranylgeranyl diphosphate synthase type II
MSQSISVPQVSQIITDYQEVLDEQIKKLVFPNEPSFLYDPLRYFLTLGGKRTRPLMTLLGCHLFGMPGLKAMNAALAIELFHNFTLIHDDIMDEAPLRRGKVTVHEKWNTNVGILSGDVLFVEAYKLLANHNVAVLPDLLEVFSKTAVEVCEGQQLDMDFESREDVSIDDYVEMIRLKTSVLLGAALKMGGIIGGASKEELKHLYDFGQNVGIAFQIQDDILDLYANPDKFGKQIGGDVLCNKKTFLLIKAFELADDQQRLELNEILAMNPSKLKVEKARNVFDALEVKQIAKDKMRAYYENAKNSLQLIHVAKENKAPLLYIGEYLMNREI